MPASRLAAVEAECGCEELASEAMRFELGGDGVDAGYLVLEIRVLDDDPLEPERVGLPVEGGAAAPSRRRSSSSSMSL